MILKLDICTLNAMAAVCFKALMRTELQYHLESARHTVLHWAWSQNGGRKGRVMWSPVKTTLRVKEAPANKKKENT